MISRLENIHWFAKLVNYKKRRTKTCENENFDYDHQDTRNCKSMDLGKKLQKKTTTMFCVFEK